MHPNKTRFIEVEKKISATSLVIVSLENPTKVNPSLILMTTNESGTSIAPLFTHNCQIKHDLVTLIFDNGSQKNLVAQGLVHRLSLPTTPQPNPYQLGWAKEVPHLIVSQHCVVTFLIGPFRDIVLCDVSPLDCANLLVGIAYPHARNVVYHAKHHKYHLQHEDHTYVFTSFALTSIQPLTSKVAIKKVNINQYIPLCLVRSVRLEKNPNPVSLP